MISHHAYRRALLSDPRNEDAPMRSHREACADCARYAERLLRFESRLEDAMQLHLEAPRSSVWPKRLALAASVLLALAVAAVWLSVPRVSLAAAVVAHMAGEPAAWNTSAAVPDSQLTAVLSDAHLRLRTAAGVVSYANSCEFRGHRVPHLVVQSASGPVTVMVLVHEAVDREVSFDEQGYRGVIVPVAGHGSIALLMRGGGAPIADVDGIATRVRDAVVWLPQALDRR